MPEIENPFLEKRKKSLGEKEVEIGSYLVSIFRWADVDMPTKEDERHVARTGELLKRWWEKQKQNARNRLRRLGRLP